MVLRANICDLTSLNINRHILSCIRIIELDKHVGRYLQHQNIGFRNEIAENKSALLICNCLGSLQRINPGERGLTIIGNDERS